MKPRKGLVAIKPQKTEADFGGFQLPEQLRKVIPVGIIESKSDCEGTADLNVGDTVAYHPSNNANVDGLILVHQEDILAIL